MFSILQKFEDFWKKEWTAFWGWTKVTAGLIVAAVPVVSQGIGTILNEPKVQAAIDQLHLDPKIGLGLAALGAVTLVSMAHA